MPNEQMLSVRAKQLAEKAKQRMCGMQLNLHPSALERVETTTRRMTSPAGEKWVHIDLKVDDEYLENGRGMTDYFLAHELGHAVRIATGAEPPEVVEVYEHVEVAEMGTQQKNDYIDEQRRAVRVLIYYEEVVAWDIARDLLRDVDHDSGTLTLLRNKSLEGYRQGFRI